MSRVDEALKRAAGSSGAGEIGGAGAARAFEEYPVEDGSARGRVDEVRKAPSISPIREFHSAPIAAPRVAGGAHQLSSMAPDVEGKIVIDAETSAASVEEYRRLATSLHLLQTQSGLKTLMISSALPRDGKTLTSTNLALTLSESYRRKVLLIDADLRRPSVHNVFRVPNAIGLADSLRSAGATPLAYIQVSSHLTILPSGPPDSAPMAGLTSNSMRSIISEARSQFDWVILDTPPVGLISDANLLASLAEGVLLVVGAGETPYAAVQRAVSEFGRERIMGVVLNRVNDKVLAGTYYREYYPSHDREAKS